MGKITHWMVLEAELKIPYKTYQEGNILACTKSVVVSVSNICLENRRNIFVHCCKLHGLQEWSSSLNHAEQIGIVSFYF
jgi:antirestriction protein